MVAQMVKKLPAMQETLFNPWIGKIPWRREWQPSILAWRIPRTEEPGGGYSPWGCKELDTTERLTHKMT